jgi:hypothetical protein
MAVGPPPNHAEAVKLVQRGCPSQWTIVVWPKIKPREPAAKCLTEIRQALALRDGVGRELDAKIRSVFLHDRAPSRADMIDCLDTDIIDYIAFAASWIALQQESGFADLAAYPSLCSGRS